MASYVFEQAEVVLTGRKASKKLRSGRDETLYEITPVSKLTGSWCKWVTMSQLFEVMDDEDEEE
jgi:hypothetical protein